MYMSLTIVINSCKSYENITLPRILGSLFKNNPGFPVLVISGGHDSFRTVISHPPLTIVETDINSFEYTAFITLSENPQLLKTDWILFLHDTIGIGDTFFQRVQSLQLPTDATTVSFRFPSANIGLYHKSIFEKDKHVLKILKNKDCSQDMLNSYKSFTIVTEDAFFRMNMGRHLFFPNPSVPLWDSGTTDPFNTGTQRIKEVFPDLDCWKFKASWALKDTYTLSP